MRAIIATNAFVLLMGFSGITPAAADDFNNRGVDFLSQAARAERGPVHYNTNTYNAAHNPTVFKTLSNFNNRNGDLRTTMPIDKKRASYSRFECDVVITQGYSDKGELKKSC